jgi:hypothetical protein
MAGMAQPSEEVLVQALVTETAIDAFHEAVLHELARAGTVEPEFRMPDRPSKPEPFADELSARLKAEAGTSRRRRQTPKQLHTDLVALR